MLMFFIKKKRKKREKRKKERNKIFPTPNIYVTGIYPALSGKVMKYPIYFNFVYTFA